MTPIETLKAGVFRLLEMFFADRQKYGDNANKIKWTVTTNNNRQEVLYIDIKHAPDVLRIFDQGPATGQLDLIGLITLVANVAGYDFELYDTFTGYFTPQRTGRR